MNRPFCNNLKTGDKVWDVENKRPGEVIGQPRESSTTAVVRFQGSKTGMRVGIMRLRFIQADGVPEDVPPFEGDLPVKGETAIMTKLAPVSAVGALKQEREGCMARKLSLEHEFKLVRQRIEQLDRALAILDPGSETGVVVPRAG